MQLCLALGVSCLLGGFASAGTLPPERIESGGATIEVTYGPGDFDVDRALLHQWIVNAADAVTTYFGRFPVPLVRLRVNCGEGRTGVYRGTTWGRDFGSFTRITVGQKTTANDLTNDWMMTHELMHTGFPNVDDEHHWIEEGLATYVEPIARVQAGQMPAERIWADMVRDMPQGEPRTGDEGLDHTHSWGRTYWGGALFLLSAEVRIREQTQNRKGLQDALRAIVEAGGRINQDWPLEKAFETGDRATGTKVLAGLYSEMKAAPARVDLDAIWKLLGVEKSGREILFHDDAPLAAARRAITNKRSP